MAGDQVSQLETGIEPIPGPAEKQVKSQSHHFWAETVKASQTHSTLQPRSARAAQTTTLKLPGGQELLVDHLVHYPPENTVPEAYPTAMVKPGLQHLQQSQLYNFPWQA